MALRYFGTSVVSSSTSVATITAATDDYIYIAAGVDIVSTNNSGIGGNGPTSEPRVDVVVAGHVIGRLGGINLWDAVVRIEATGSVQTQSNSAVRLSGTFSSLHNEGSISIGAQSTGVVYIDSTSAYVFNSGTIANKTPSGYSAVSLLGIGGNSLVNTGTIIGGVSFGGGVDKMWNSGLVDGYIGMGNGDDLFDGRGGRTLANVDGGDGNDALLGGDFADQFSDYGGANWIVGGGGDDTITILADALTDTIFAGEVNGVDSSANDTISVASATGVNIFLGGRYVSQVAAGQPVVAWITGFENADGGSGNDALIGTAGANILDGKSGGDWLVGNGGADTFRFGALAEIAAGDRAADFRRSEGDRIDISRIDANSALAGDQAFAFRTAHTANTAAEAVIISNGSTGATVNLYVNADNIVDASFFVAYGEAATTSLLVGDFIL